MIREPGSQEKRWGEREGPLVATGELHHHLPRFPWCSSRVQPKVRRNGRGGWTKQEVRAGGRQATRIVRQLSASGGRGGAFCPVAAVLVAAFAEFSSAYEHACLQDDLLRRMVAEYGAKNWKMIGASADDTLRQVAALGVNPVNVPGLLRDTCHDYPAIARAARSDARAQDRRAAPAAPC